MIIFIIFAENVWVDYQSAPKLQLVTLSRVGAGPGNNMGPFGGVVSGKLLLFIGVTIVHRNDR